MTLVPLPALADNHTWMLKRGPDPFEADPGPAQPTFDTLGRGEPQLAAILDTRHRADPARRKSHPILRIREATFPEAMRVHAGPCALASDT
ncbi:hypothetical protein WKW79_26035 [Variovorax robiniae]|uniref:Uncharacterized protein n=1 Tax=Variovorax robiniae TaxID=1836199 RepID=A0ABU8XDY8_9BURK